MRDALKREYAKLLGELQRLQKPPKYETRLVADRIKYEAGEAQRAGRAGQIASDLPHLAHVIHMFDPLWDEHQVKPLRPNVGRKGLLPSISYAGAAMDILRETDGAYTIGEMVKLIAERYDVDVASSAAYQKVHTAVNNGLKGSYREYIKSVGGRPERFARIDLPEKP